MTNAKQPTEDMSKEQLLSLLRSYYDAIVELQLRTQLPSPESVAARAGRVSIGYLASATVTDPATGNTFTGDVYVTAVET